MGLGVGIECHFHQGCHIDEADLIVEVINPDTGKVLPKGEEGELVITSLAREGMPLIRYRTRDLSRIIKGHCECGSFLKRIDTIAKRIGTEIEIGNDRVYPSVFDEIFFSIPEIIDYQIGVKREEEAVKLIFIVDALKRGKIIQTKIKEVILKHSLVQEMIRKNKIGLDIKYVPGCGNKDYCQYKRSSVFRV
jgi:phenylacetate-CoA ligase